MKKRTLIKIKGIVQGVGFRPFIYTSAYELGLKGWVNNSSEGVTIDVEGIPSSLNKFINKIHITPPPLSKIDSIQLESLPIKNYKIFEITPSDSSEDKTTLISPDICTCDDCFTDIMDKSNPRYRYPFTNCTNCGPRFSIIKSLPYDRASSTMKNFDMCSHCNHEYTDPFNRRFHAQPNACDQCGPQIWLEDSKGNILHCDDVIEKTQSLLKDGRIVAIKGIGGFNLACDAFNPGAIEELRKRKNRPHKPFAVMMDSISLIKRTFELSELELRYLTSKERPIVILASKRKKFFPNALSPGIDSCGIMLPYSPLHKLLFKEEIKSLVMTSGNLSGLPLEYTNEGARKNLSSITDYFLMHDRDIYSPIDDSVLKIVDDIPIMIRRARGYVPLPLDFECTDNILSLGGDMKNTFSFTKGDKIFMSQYNGNLYNLESISNYHRNIQIFSGIYDLEPQCMVHDKHPQYYTSEHAHSFENMNSLDIYSIQHHHAHTISCMAENSLQHEKVLSIVFDGTGFGDDGSIWGGEFLLADISSYERLSHIQNMTVAGGPSSPRYPYKIALSYLSSLKGWDDSISDGSIDNIIDSILSDLDLTPDYFHALSHCCEKGINTFTTSSVGRLFDCVSSLIRLCHISSYEGQAAMELENLIPLYKFDDNSCYNEVIDCINDYPYIHVLKLLNCICTDILNGEPQGDISLKFHNTLVFSIVDTCKKLRKNRPSDDIQKICLSGGVFQNSFLLSKTVRSLRAESFEVFTHRDYPCNDGGVSLGQIVYGNHLLLNGGNKNE